MTAKLSSLEVVEAAKERCPHLQKHAMREANEAGVPAFWQVSNANFLPFPILVHLDKHPGAAVCKMI